MAIYNPANDTWAWVAQLELPFPDHQVIRRAAVLNGEVHISSRDGVWRYNGAAWVKVGDEPSIENGPCEFVLLG